MKRNRSLLIGILLTATAGFIVLQNGLAPATVGMTEIPPITSTNTPTTTPTFEPCGYIWAYQDVPELAIKIENTVLTLDPNARVRVQAFGENCVYSDGSATFGAMETDVYIHIPVEDLTNEEAFGNWMAQVLPLIIQVSEDEFPGGYGFVEFWFEKNNGESVVVQVQIPEYFEAEAQTKSGAELFHLFYDKP